MLFDWDDGNREKCQKHGLTIAEIEAVLSGDFNVRPDPQSPAQEPRFQVIEQAAAGRHVFIVFTFRETRHGTAIRPISARYMHAKEVRKYEQG